MMSCCFFGGVLFILHLLKCNDLIIMTNETQDEIPRCKVLSKNAVCTHVLFIGLKSADIGQGQKKNQPTD